MVSIKCIYFKTDGGEQFLYLIKPHILITYGPRLTQVREDNLHLLNKLVFASFQKVPKIKS